VGLVSKLLSFVRTQRFNTPISDVKVDIGGRPLKTLEHFSAPGDDSYPLVGDYVAALSQIQTGRMSAVGYHDPINTPVTLAGGKRIYARNESGESISQVWLKNDKNIQIDNEFGFATITPEGIIKVNNSIAEGTFFETGKILLNNAVASATLFENGKIALTNGLGTISIASNGDVDFDNGSGFIKIDSSGNVNINGVIIDSSGDITAPNSLVLNNKELNSHTHGGVQSGSSNTGPNN